MTKEVYSPKKREPVIAVLVALLVCLGGFLFPSLPAAAAAKVQVAIPVVVKATGISEVFEVVASPQTAGEEVRKLYLTDDKEKELVLTFTQEDLGEHYYTLSQTKGNQETVTYDDGLFWIYVRVTQEGDGLQAVTTLWKEGTDVKLEKVTFTNTMEAEPDDDGSGEAPDDGSTGDGADSDGSQSGGANGGDQTEPDQGDGSGTDSNAGSTGSAPGTTGSTAGGSFWSSSFWGNFTGSGSTSYTGLIRTGDLASPWLWLGGLLASSLLLLFIWRYRKKQDNWHTQKGQWT